MKPRTPIKVALESALSIADDLHHSFDNVTAPWALRKARVFLAAEIRSVLRLHALRAERVQLGRTTFLECDSANYHAGAIYQTIVTFHRREDYTVVMRDIFGEELPT